LMMISQYRTIAAWLADGPLAACGATRLRSRRAGRLTVRSGQAWITREGDPEDHVLAAGEALTMGARQEVLVEPWVGGAPVRLAWRSDEPPTWAARVSQLLASVGLRAAAAGSGSACAAAATDDSSSAEPAVGVTALRCCLE